MEQMKAEMAATEDMVAKWLEKNCDDSGFYLDMHLAAFPVDYKVGPGEAEGASDREIKMRKMKQNWVLGMRARPRACSVRNVRTRRRPRGGRRWSTERVVRSGNEGGEHDRQRRRHAERGGSGCDGRAVVVSMENERRARAQVPKGSVVAGSS